jgi:hypothetical protein
MVREWTVPSRRLCLVVREDGDVDVQLHVANQPGSPFEAHFAIPDGDERDASVSIGRFIADILQERILYGLGSRFRSGTHGWLRRDNVPTHVRPGTLVSWHGTVDG